MLLVEMWRLVGAQDLTAASVLISVAGDGGLRELYGPFGDQQAFLPQQET